MSHLKYDRKIISREEKIYTVLIIYDIIDDKKRNKMAKFLEGYGIRVQKSAFEARLTRKNCDAMIKRAEKIIDVEKDSLRVYLLPDKTYIRFWGTQAEHLQDIIII